MSSLGDLGNTPVSTQVASNGPLIPGLLSNVATFEREAGAPKARVLGRFLPSVGYLPAVEGQLVSSAAVASKEATAGSVCAPNHRISHEGVAGVLGTTAAARVKARF